MADLREQAEKVPDDVKTEVEAKVKAVRDALAGQDIEAVRNATAELGESVQKIGAALYEEAGAEAATDAPPGEDGEAPADEEGEAQPEEGTVEGEFREV